MANTFINKGQVCTVSLTQVYTPSSGTTAVVLMIQATNVTSRADTLTLVWTDSANGNAVTHLCYQVPIPAQQSVGCLTGKMVLKYGDTLMAQCGTQTAIELTVSVLETS